MLLSITHNGSQLCDGKDLTATYLSDATKQPSSYSLDISTKPLLAYELMLANVIIMFIFQVHIKNEAVSMDDEVYVNMTLPFLPPVGSILHITDEMQLQLEAMAKSSLDIAQRYAPKWFYGKSRNCDEPNKDNIDDLSFADAIYVTKLLFKANCDIVEIEINDTDSDD